MPHYSCSISPILPPTQTRISSFPVSNPPKPNQSQAQLDGRSQCSPLRLRIIPSAALKAPRGLGPSSRKKTKKPKPKKTNDDENDEDNDDSEDEEGVIPEIVTSRMMRRMGFSVGIPLFVGLSFFPFFYYLKVGLKVDVPSWVPVMVSFIFFGSALAGVSYGIVSSSWDPMREGSLLGWNEAQKNWPVFWRSIWSSADRNK